MMQRIFLLSGFVAIFVGCGRERTSAPTLTIYAAASLKGPLEAAIAEYRREHAEIEISLDLGASQSQLTKLELGGGADLFIPADASYVGLAERKGIIAERTLLAFMRPVLAVKKGNPLGINSLDSLLQSSAKIAQADPETAAVGKITRETLAPLGNWETLKHRTTVFKGNVNEAANDLKLGAVDAAFIWNVMLGSYPELEAVPIEEFANTRSEIVVAALRNSMNSEQTNEFVKFLVSPAGFTFFREAGFESNSSNQSRGSLTPPLDTPANGTGSR